MGKHDGRVVNDLVRARAKGDAPGWGGGGLWSCRIHLEERRVSQAVK